MPQEEKLESIKDGLREKFINQAKMFVTLWLYHIGKLSEDESESELGVLLDSDVLFEAIKWVIFSDDFQKIDEPSRKKMTQLIYDLATTMGAFGAICCLLSGDSDLLDTLPEASGAIEYMKKYDLYDDLETIEKCIKESIVH